MYIHNQHQTDFSANMTTDLSPLGIVGNHTGALTGPEELSLEWSTAQRTSNWQARRIIPDECTVNE